MSELVQITIEVDATVEDGNADWLAERLADACRSGPAGAQIDDVTATVENVERV